MIALLRITQLIKLHYFQKYNLLIYIVLNSVIYGFLSLEKTQPINTANF